MYRYFSDVSACHNFINGNIWLAGSNQNRFFHEKADPNEHYYQRHSRISLVVLSLTTKSPADPSPFMNMPCVVIKDIHGFVRAIKSDLDREGILYQITWLDKKDLLDKAKDCLNEKAITVVHNIKYNPVEKCETLSVTLGSMWGRKIEYYDPETPVKPLSMEAVQRGSSKSKSYEDESEYRLEFNIGKFFNKDGRCPEECLYHLIQYIKLSCPSVSNYCQLL